MAAAGMSAVWTPAYAKKTAPLKSGLCSDGRPSPSEVFVGRLPTVIGKRIDDIESLDPHRSVSSSGVEIIGNLYETLAVWNPATKTAEVNRALVESLDRSVDGLIWKFVLARGRKFASGNPVTAADVEYSIERLFEINGAASSVFGPFGKISASLPEGSQGESFEVSLRLQEGAPSRLLLPCLTASACSILDRKLVSTHHAADPDWAEAVAVSGSVNATSAIHDRGAAWLDSNSAGSGPFRIARTATCDVPDSRSKTGSNGAVPRNDEILLVPNEHHPAYSGRSRPIVIRSIVDPVEQRKQLENREIHVASNVALPVGERISSFAKDSTPAGNLLMLCMNVSDSEGRLDVEGVRQAIRCAIDVFRLAADLGSQRWSAQHEFCPSVMFGAQPGVPGLGTASPFSQSEARTRLDAAGITGRLNLTIDHVAGNPRSHVATLLANQLDAAGFRIKLRPSSGKVFMNRLGRRDYQIALVTWNADYPDPHCNAHALCFNDPIENRNSVSLQRTMAWYCRWFDGGDDDGRERREGSMAIAKKAAGMPGDVSRRDQYKLLQARLMSTGPYAFLLEETRITVSRQGGPATRGGLLDSFTKYPTI